VQQRGYAAGAWDSILLHCGIVWSALSASQIDTHRRTERRSVRIAFSADGRPQTITWEWRPKGQWLPLCDRVAYRED
jgi:hypothetical protein